MKNNKFDELMARLARKALCFWEAREALCLVIAAGIAAMIWLPLITGKPTITILGVPPLIWAAKALLRPGHPPLL